MGYVFDPAAVLTGQYLDWFIWGLATTIVWAWVLTIPMAALVGFLLRLLFGLF